MSDQQTVYERQIARFEAEIRECKDPARLEVLKSNLDIERRLLARLDKS